MRLQRQIQKDTMKGMKKEDTVKQKRKINSLSTTAI